MIPGLALLWQVTPAYVRRRKLRTALAFISVALAVALFVATRVADYSLLRAFERTTDALLGSAQFVVTQGLGVSSEALSALERVPGVRAAPVIQRPAVAEELGVAVTVLGIDFARDSRVRRYTPAGQFDLAALLLNPRAVVVPQSFAAKHGLTLGGTLVISAEAGTQRFTVAGLLHDEGPAAAMGGRVVVMCMAAADALLGLQGRHDRIDIVLDPPATPEAVRAVLPSGYVLLPAPRENAVLDFSLTQMRLISQAVTLVAVLIGAFIVFNSTSLAVVERTTEIATLRALGARRVDVMTWLVGEAVALGLPAALAGTGLGLGLAHETIRQVSASVLMMVGTLPAASVEAPPDVWIVAPLLGVLTTVAGAAAAVRAAARVAPVTSLARAAQPHVQRRRLRSWLFASVPLGVASIVVLVHPGSPREACVAAFGTIILALALAMPQLVLWLTAPGRALARRWLSIESYLAFDAIAGHPARTSLTVVAFAGSLSIVVALSGMLRGFDHALRRWMDEVFAFELSVWGGPLSGSAYSVTGFPEALLTEVRADPRVADASGARTVLAPFRGRTVMIIGFDTDAFSRMVARRAGRADAPAAADFADMEHGAAVVSDNFARLFGVRSGERIALKAPGGAREFVVTHLREDYSWPMGVVFLERQLFAELWQDRALSFVDIQLRDPAQTDALQADLTRAWRGRALVYVHKTADMKAFGAGLVRDWFKLADAQVWLALLIGGVGVANTLLVSLLGQARQIGIVRAVGATRRQVQRVLVTEALLLGSASALLGVVIGVVAAGLVAPLFMLRESGYRFSFMMPWGAVLLSATAAVVIALIATLLPIRALRRFDVVRAIGIE